MTPPIVAFSERLGPITEVEKALENEGLAVLKRVPLWNADDVAAHAADADVVMVGAVEPMDAAALRGLVQCRVVVRRGVGYDNVDVAAATEMGIAVAYVPDASVEEVSDHALALLLSLERQVVALNDIVRTEGQILERLTAVRSKVRRFSTLTLGVVGLGRIGRALARKARGIFGEVIGFDPMPAPGVEVEVRLVALEHLVATADLISLHAPLTPSTWHLFDETLLPAVKPGAYIVNTSRGALIDEAALVAALRDGRIAGAGLDVTEADPLTLESPITSAPNVILTGHSAAMSTTSTVELRERATQAARSVLLGQVPEFLANPEVLDRPNCRLARV